MELTNLLNIDYPIIQGGMANISTPDLVVAVSQAGGLGVLATGGFSLEEIRENIHRIKQATDKPFAVNVVLLHPQIQDLAQLVIDEGVDYITCGGGNPLPYFDHWVKAGIKVLPLVGNVKMAKKVQEAGALACIFEGAEAGGHIGALNTMAELPAICDAVDIPVISAGGIYTGRQILAAEVLGAQGVQVGSRFLLAEECPIHINYKNYLINALDSDTLVTGASFGHPVRVVKNRLTDQLQKLEAEGASQEEFDAMTRGAGNRAASLGDTEWGSVMSGQGLAYFDKIQPAREIILDLMDQYKEAKASLLKWDWNKKKACGKYFLFSTSLFYFLFNIEGWNTPV